MASPFAPNAGQREERFDEDRFEDDFLEDDFRDEDFFAVERLLALFFRPVFFRGTLAPFSRASDRPIAIACLRLFTLPPRPPGPLVSVPFLRRRIALATRLLAAFPYLRPDDFFADDFRADRFRVAMSVAPDEGG